MVYWRYESRVLVADIYLPQSLYPVRDKMQRELPRFTLVELRVAIAVIAILASLPRPPFPLPERTVGGPFANAS